MFGVYASGFKGSLYEERSEEGKITIMHLLRSDAEIDEADRREFYMNLGQGHGGVDEIRPRK